MGDIYMKKNMYLKLALIVVLLCGCTSINKTDTNDGEVNIKNSEVLESQETLDENSNQNVINIQDDMNAASIIDEGNKEESTDNNNETKEENKESKNSDEALLILPLIWG